MKQTPLEKRLTDLFAPVIEHHGLRLVCVRIHGETAGGHTVQVMAENPTTRRLGVDECAKLSREISTVMDVEDIMKDAYRLEVSSPGIDRPLVNLQDFADFSGYEAKIEISPPLDGRKRFRGKLNGTEDGAILLETDEGKVKLPYGDISKARLVLTDELINATKTGFKEGSI